MRSQYVEQTSTTNNSILQLPTNLLDSHKKRVVAFMLLVFFSHVPSSILQFSSDDFLQRAAIQGSSTLNQLGFTQISDAPNLAHSLTHAFHFFNAKYESLLPQKQYGNLPWWSVDEATMHPFRPIAALSHWVDFQFWPNSAVATQWHSLLYFYLFVAGGFLLYKRFSISNLGFWLALSFLVFDLSVSQNLGWFAARNAYMSCGFGLFAVYFYSQWRDTQHWRFFFAALLSFCFALLSAEAGVATAGYLGAYALVYDKSGPRRGLLATLPFALAVLIWRAGYTKMGFGASGIGLYMDPGRDPIDFIGRILDVFPVIFTSLFVARDALISGIDLEYRPLLRIVAWCTFGLIVFCFRHILKTNKAARFMFLGACFAAIPHASLLSAGSRSGVFVAIGFFYVLGAWVAHLLTQHGFRLRKALGYVLLTVHLILPMLVLVVVSYGILPINYGNSYLYEEASGQLEKKPNSNLIIVNSHAPSMLFYHPYQWDIESKKLPSKIQALAPGLSSVYLTRTSDSTLVLRSPSGFVLNQDSKMLTETGNAAPAIHRVHSYRMVAGLITSPANSFAKGDKIQGAGFTTTILETRSNAVIAIQINFQAAQDLQDNIWEAYNWADKRYYKIEPPAIHQTLYFPGPFDISAGE